jgi:glycine/D-amino acid oxidase-like deaminating enzyme/nitrite reductase/ring-hydroxylating ferredoxin subunit
LLANEGQRVLVLEADRVAAGTTGASSAHVTEVPDRGYRTLLEQVGEERARTLVDRSHVALNFIDTLVQAENIRCDFTRVPAYLFCESADDRRQLDEECRAAARLGRAADLTSDVPLPWHVHGAVRFGQQAAFHPVHYLDGLAQLAVQRGATICEGTRVLDIAENGRTVRITTARATVRARALILATHTPLGFNLVQTEVAPYRSYILALNVSQPLAPALFWDTSDPYFYLRHYDTAGTPIAIVGGADHKTGHEQDTETRFLALAEYAYARLGRGTVEAQWSAQFYEPADGLPYIGRAPRAEHIYIATGFSGVGLVQGTMAAMELAGALRGDTTTSDFPATRLAIGAARRFLAENVDVAAHWIGDRLAGGGSADDVPVGAGRVVRVNGKRRAVFRDEEGGRHVLSPVCTHMGCIVQWNTAQRSWDCPCHGARYAPTGEVLEGPALTGLAREEAADVPAVSRKSGS